MHVTYTASVMWCGVGCSRVNRRVDSGVIWLSAILSCYTASLLSLVPSHGTYVVSRVEENQSGKTSFSQVCRYCYIRDASVSQGRICSDNFMCCPTEIEVADQTFHLTQSQYTDTGPTSPSTDPIMPGAWQGCHWSANF